MPGTAIDIPAALIAELAVKSLPILAGMLAVTWFMRRSSAAARHLCLALAAAALLALPLASMLLPSWPLGVFGNLPSLAHAGPAALQAPVPAETLKTSESPAISQATEPRGTAMNATADEVGLARATPDQTSAAGWSRWLLLGWAAGAAVLFGGLIAGKLYGLWSIRKAALLEDGPLARTVTDIAARLGLDRAIEVRESARFKVPSVTGVFRPRLLLPLQARTWPAERLRAILHHELAHVRRRDILVQLGAQIACCLYWLNPLVWILERRLFIERERACDDVAIRLEIKASDYAEHLLEVLEEMGDMKKTTWVTAAMAEGTDFRDRIISVLNPVVPRGAPGRGQALAIMAVVLLLIVPLSALSPWSASSAAHSLFHQRGDDLLMADDWGPNARSGAVRTDPQRAERTRSREAREERQADAPKEREMARSEEGDRNLPLDLLLEMLEDPAPAVRESAARILGRREEREAVPALIGALDDENAGVREHVATALGQVQDERAVQPLCKVLLDDSEAVVREHAAAALEMIGDVRAVPALLEAARSDPADSVRRRAVLALDKLQ
jgi:beta-lactamase regulating signal transducer with metallopeptidase domain